MCRLILGSTVLRLTSGWRRDGGVESGVKIKLAPNPSLNCRQTEWRLHHADRTAYTGLAAKFLSNLQVWNNGTEDKVLATQA